MSPILFNVLITVSNRNLVHWVDRPDQKEMAAQQRVLKTMEKGRRRQFRTTLDKSEHPRVRSNHSEIMETFGGKETELVLAIHQGEHLGGLQVSKGVPQGPSRSPRGPWLFNELVKCGA